MENANNLAAAMFIAPFAGVAAAAGKYYQIVKTGEKNDEGGPSNESE